jgi:hypothetical protein
MADKPTGVESRNEDAEGMESNENDSTLSLDPETIDSDYKYRFVYHDKNRFARMMMRGYEFVTRDDPERLKYSLVAQYTTEGYLAVGDSVLMRCAKKRYDRRRKEIRTLNEGRMGEGANQKAIEDIKKIEEQTGIRTPVITS